MTADLALITSDPTSIERSADPAQFVILACERAKQWLAHALEGAHIEDIVELKSQAEAIRVYTTQKQLGKDAELTAAEVVRRAERGIGIAIRRGQQAGTINSPGRNVQTLTDDKTKKISDILTPGTTTIETYAMTDGVSDEQFDAAIGEAKVEGNLSRANVVRKVRAAAPDLNGNTPAAVAARQDLVADLASQGYSSRQIAARVGITEQGVRGIATREGIEIPADKVMHKTRRLDSTRIVRENVSALEATAFSLKLVDYDEVDLAEIGDWAISLTESMRALNRFHRKIKEMAQ